MASNNLTTASVASVGHNPTLSAVAAWLLDDSSVELHVGHAVVMEMRKWHFYPGTGRLVEYISAE
jgi:phosphohistidine phosphatase SixA